MQPAPELMVAGEEEDHGSNGGRQRQLGPATAACHEQREEERQTHKADQAQRAGEPEPVEEEEARDQSTSSVAQDVEELDGSDPLADQGRVVLHGALGDRERHAEQEGRREHHQDR